MKINLIAAGLVLSITSINYATYITMPEAHVLKATFCNNGLHYFSNNSDLAYRLGKQRIDATVIPIIAAFAAERFNIDQERIDTGVQLMQTDIESITYCIIASIN